MHRYPGEDGVDLAGMSGRDAVQCNPGLTPCSCTTARYAGASTLKYPFSERRSPVLEMCFHLARHRQ